MTFVFYVRGQALSGFVPDVVVSDTINYQNAEVHFSEDWDGLDKWLHLKSPDGVEYEARLVDDRVENLNLSAGRWEVWFHGSRPGEDGTDDLRITTDTTAFVVEQSGSLDGDPLPPIELTAAEQIAAAVTRAETEVAELREDVEQYKQDVDEAAQAVQAAKVAAEAAAVGAFGSQAAADQSAQAAHVSEQNAERAKKAIEDMSVQAITLDTGADSTVTKEMVGDAVRLIFGIARGERGPEGPEGPVGASVERIERTSGTGAPGETDTYTGYLSNGETFSFSVYNGRDGKDGKDGKDGEGAGDFLADGSVAMTGALRMGCNRISDVGEPSGDNDAVRKVDLAGKADLVSGKVPAEQLPDMNYAPASHALDTANPHGVTAAQVGAVSKFGDTMQYSLNFADTGGGTNVGQIIQWGNTFRLRNNANDGSKYADLILTNADNGGIVYEVNSGDARQIYNVYHSGNKPTASDIQAGTLAGQVYANPTASATHNAFQVRNICAQDSDIVAGASALQSGYIVLVYE